MSKTNSKINVPDWWTQTFLTKMSQGSHQYLADDPGMRVIPPMHSHELQMLLLLLGYIQKRLISDETEGLIFIRLQEILDEYAFLNEMDRFSLVRMFFTLPAIYLKSDRSPKDTGLNSLFQIDKVQLDEICVNVEQTQIENIVGYSDYYSHELSDLQPVQRVLQLDPRLWMKLEGLDRKLFLLVVKELHNLNSIPTDTEIILDEGLFHACLRDQDLDLKSVLKGFAQRLGMLGYLDPMDGDSSESQYVKFAHLGRVHFRINEELLPTENMQLMQAFSRLKISSYSDSSVRQMADSFYGSALDEMTSRHLKSFWEKLRDQPSVLGGSIWVQNLGIVQIPLLFIEWCLRNSPLHPNPLPKQVQNSLFSDLCYLAHENIIEHYTKFRKIMMYDSHVKAFIAKHSSELVRSRSDYFTMQQSSNGLPKTDLGKAKTTTAPLIQTPQVRPAEPKEVIAADRREPLEDIVKKNKLNSINIADSELWRIKKFDTNQYQSLKQQYIQSLGEIDQKVLKEVEGQMRKDLFEQQIHKRIVKYMVANPGKWNSVTTRS